MQHRSSRPDVENGPLRSRGLASAEWERLRHREELYRLAVQATNDLIWDLDLQTGELSWNEALFTCLGYHPNAVEPTLQWWTDHLHPEDRQGVADRFHEVLLSREDQFIAEYRFEKADGSYVWVYDRGFIVRDECGRATRGVGVMQDQTARKLAEEALAKSEALSRSIIEANPDCVSVLDLNGCVMFSNKAAVAAYELENDEELVGRRWGHKLDAKARRDIDAALPVASTGKLAQVTIRIRHSSAGDKWYESILAPISDADGLIVRYVVMSRDITNHKSAESRIRWSANHDPLTKLPNRLLFQQRLDQLIQSASRNACFALLVIDVDEFKQVNDALGHEAGDLLLCTVAERVSSVLQPDDFVARLGGDEFAVLLKWATNECEVRAVSEKIIAVLKQPWIYSGKALDCRASIGASIYGCHGTKSSELLRNADVALYTAKELGRCRTALFEPRMQANAQKRTQMVEIARRALRDDLIVPYYQPQVDLWSGKIVGYEALLRIQDPAQGVLKPSHISAALEDIGLAAEIGNRMARLVISDVSRWLKEGVDIGHVAINAGAADFRSGDFAERLLEQLTRQSVPPENIQLEVTERVFMGRGAEYVEFALKGLRRSGVRIALDDFGTGYASLSQLQQLPIDVIKIDRSLVQKTTTGAKDAAIARAVIMLGKSLGLEVVAEGVERPAEEVYLRAEGCHLVQGFLYGKPVLAARVSSNRRALRPAA